jgi:hypothetical protein
LQNPLNMSKKRPNSDREIDLPDWADDVTPSDEVMKKFYAPTGTFKSGPIAVPAPTPNTYTPTKTDETRPDQEILPEARGAEKADDTHYAKTREVNTELQQYEPAVVTQIPLQTIVTDTEEIPEATPSPSASGNESLQTQQIESFEQVTASPTPDPARTSTDQAQSSSFEEFARKWRRYLYPGQLAVMRTLYELTLARGTSECFTQYSQIASSTKMTRRNCINVMNSLVDRGFVERLEVRNDATGKGIRLRIHSNPLS